MNSVVILNQDTEILFPVRWHKERESICKHMAGLAKSLVSMFHHWGFNSFHAVKTIVRRFYPEVDEKELLELYQGTVIRESVLKYVHYTYQILNV